MPLPSKPSSLALFSALLICESMSFMTCYFHFPRSSGKQMSDNGMWANGCAPPAHLCTLLARPRMWWAESRFPKAFPDFSWPSGVVFTLPIKYVKPPVFSPHMYNKKIWLQLLLHPKGNFQNSSPPHLSEMKLSRFLRFAEICLLILNHTGFHWLHDQDKCLSYLFMSVKMTLQLSNVETWLQTLMLCWLWVRVS